MYHPSVKKKSRNRLVGFPTKAKRELLRALTYPLPLPSPAVSFNNWNQNSGALVRILKARGGWGEWLMTQIWCVQIKKCKKKKARRLKNTKIDLPLSGWGQKLTVTCEPSLRFHWVLQSAPPSTLMQADLQRKVQQKVEFSTSVKSCQLAKTATFEHVSKTVIVSGESGWHFKSNYSYNPGQCSPCITTRIWSIFGYGSPKH